MNQFNRTVEKLFGKKSAIEQIHHEQEKEKMTLSFLMSEIERNKRVKKFMVRRNSFQEKENLEIDYMTLSIAAKYFGKFKFKYKIKSQLEILFSMTVLKLDNTPKINKLIKKTLKSPISEQFILVIFWMIYCLKFNTKFSRFLVQLRK